MPRKRHTEKHTNDTRKEWVPPRGIHYSFNEGRPFPFRLHWRDARGKRQSKTYRDEGSRELAARALAEKKESHGRSILNFDPVEWQRFVEFKRIVAGADPVVVAHEWVEARRGAGKAEAGLLVKDAVARYIELRKGEEKLSDDTWRHFDKHLTERFAGSFGVMELRDITADNIRAWLSSLTSSRTGESMEPLTLRHHRKDVNTFLDRAVREGWLARNPCELVAVPSVEDKDVFVCPVDDAVRFFEVNKGEPVIARIALEAFAGLRYSTAGRIQKSNINFVERGIEMPGIMHKSGKRKFRQGHPENLWAWLARAPEETWTMTLRQYAEEKKSAFIRAGMKGSTAKELSSKLRNIWRHSFASYHLALHRNMPLTQYLMQHRHMTTTEIYEGVATNADAGKYFAITP